MPSPNGTMIAIRTLASRTASRTSLRKIVVIRRSRISRFPSSQRPAGERDEHVFEGALVRVDGQHLSVPHPAFEPLGIGGVIQPQRVLTAIFQQDGCRALAVA